MFFKAEMTSISGNKVAAGAMEAGEPRNLADKRAPRMTKSVINIETNLIGPQDFKKTKSDSKKAYMR